MSTLDALKRKQLYQDRRSRRGKIVFWIVMALVAALVLAIAGEFPELAVIVP